MACATTSTIAEGTTLWITAEFFDRDSLAATPTTVTYKVLCLTTGTTINASGSVSAASSVEIEITSAENTMLGTGAKEKRRVIVPAAYGSGDQHVETIDYYVRALS